MAKTFNLTVNAAGDPESIVAQSVCTTIELGENPSVASYPTTQFIIRQPLPTSDAVYVDIGRQYVFRAAPRKFFLPGDVVGYAELPSGSTTMYQLEQ